MLMEMKLAVRNEGKKDPNIQVIVNEQFFSGFSCFIQINASRKMRQHHLHYGFNHGSYGLTTWLQFCVCACVCTYTYIYTLRIYTHTYIYTHIYSTYIHIYMCIHTYTYHMHAYIHMYIYLYPPPSLLLNLTTILNSVHFSSWNTEQPVWQVKK